jgi:adenylylsulfate kinase
MRRSKNNIYPVFHNIINRENKENLLNQKAKAIWMSGLSGAGKSTIANGLEKELFKRGFLTQILDGDYIRSGINRKLDPINRKAAQWAAFFHYIEV